MIKATRLSELGFTLTDVRFHVHDLARTLGIQGLLGLRFLKQFRYEIRRRKVWVPEILTLGFRKF